MQVAWVEVVRIQMAPDLYEYVASSNLQIEARMAIPNSPIRIDPELAAVARSTAESMSRSLSQQIAHWARIGRELERSQGVAMSSIQAVLDGQGDYDALNSPAQAVVRVNWAERIDEARKTLRLDRVLAAKGREVVCAFRRSRPLIPIDAGRVFRGMSAA